MQAGGVPRLVPAPSAHHRRCSCAAPAWTVQAIEYADPSGVVSATAHERRRPWPVQSTRSVIDLALHGRGKSLAGNAEVKNSVLVGMAVSRKPKTSLPGLLPSARQQIDGCHNPGCGRRGSVHSWVRRSGREQQLPCDAAMCPATASATRPDLCGHRVMGRPWLR